MPVLDKIGTVFGVDIPAFTGVTSQMGPFSPSIIESGIIDPRTGMKMGGTFLGTSGRGGEGGIFRYDEFIAHRAAKKLEGKHKGEVAERVANATNTLIFGKMLNRKSAGAKLKILRGWYQFGYNHLVTDRKGHEYAALANYIPGSKTLKFGKGSNVFINPFDPVMPMKVQLELLKSLVSNALIGGANFARIY
jgi:hypothetical protein